MEPPVDPGGSATTALSEQYTVPIINNFSDLSDMEDMDENPRANHPLLHAGKKRSVSTRYSAGTSGVNAPKKQFTEINKGISVQVNKFEFKMPPIKAYNINAKELNIVLTAKLKKRYCIKNINKDLSVILTDSLEDYNVCIDELTVKKNHYYTYTPNELKPINVLLKNIHCSYSEEEVSAELLSLTFLNPNTQIIKVGKYATMRSKREKRILSIYLVQLSPSSQVEELTDIKYLLNQQVVWEAISRSDIMQCYRCQRFNHTARNCQMPYRCVKCKAPHEYGKCPTDKLKAELEEERNKQMATDGDGKDSVDNNTAQATPPPSCINCGQVGHPANYRKCPMYKTMIERHLEKINKEQERHQQTFNDKTKYFRNYVR